MPFAKRRKPPELSDDEVQELETIRRLRTEERPRPVRATILLDARAGMSNPTIVRAHHVSRNTVVRCTNKC